MNDDIFGMKSICRVRGYQKNKNKCSVMRRETIKKTKNKTVMSNNASQ